MEAEPIKTEPPKRKRRWFQFSLRGVLIFTLIIAIPCAWIGRKIEQKQIERAAVEAIVKSGGKVLYDFQQVTDEPSGPKWLRSVLGEYFFSEVDEVDLNNRTGVDCAGLRSLKVLPHLQSLVLTGRVGDAELEDLNGLTRLQKLLFATTNVTDSGLIHLKDLAQLEVDPVYWTSKCVVLGGVVKRPAAGNNAAMSDPPTRKRRNDRAQGRGPG